MNKLEKVALAVPFVLKLKIQNNSLKSQNESLKSTIQDELYKTFMNKLGEPQEIERLKRNHSSMVGGIPKTISLNISLGIAPESAILW